MHARDLLENSNELVIMTFFLAEISLRQTMIYG